jgi:PEP-CTERM motif
MKRLCSALLCSLAAASSAQAQGFTNLDFEAAVVVPTVPGFGFLSWDLAVPGWSHSPGSDTGIVYYGATHVGTTQWFRLLDGGSAGGSPLEGNYAMQFASGYATAPIAGTWVNAYLSQTGLVPADAMSLTFLASRPVAVTIDGVPAAATSLGAASFAVDISAHAGSVVEMRFINTTLQMHDPVTLDGVAFSTAPVPEPATWWLFGLGAASALMFSRTTRFA